MSQGITAEAARQLAKAAVPTKEKLLADVEDNIRSHAKAGFYRADWSPSVGTPQDVVLGVVGTLKDRGFDAHYTGKILVVRWEDAAVAKAI